MKFNIELEPEEREAMSECAALIVAKAKLNDMSEEAIATHIMDATLSTAADDNKDFNPAEIVFSTALIAIKVGQLLEGATEGEVKEGLGRIVDFLKDRKDEKPSPKHTDFGNGGYL